MPLPRSRRDPAADSGLKQLRIGDVLQSVVRHVEDADPSRPARRLFAVTLALLGFGLVLQASHAATTLGPGQFRVDLLWEVAFRSVALGVLLVAAMVGPARLRPLLPLVICGAIALLVCVWVPGLEAPYNGAHRWVHLGFSLQPSELARVALILWIADRTAKMGDKGRTYGRPVFKTLALVTLFAGLIGRQPDLGGALVLLICAFATMWEGGVDIKRAGAPFLLLVATVFGFVAAVRPYVRSRLGMWFGDVQNDQVAASIEALSNAGPVGTGLGLGVLRNQGFHYNDSDFVFALVAEEFGWFGMALVLLLLLAFLAFALQLVASIRDRFCATAAFGLCISVLFQALVHVQVVAGVAPPKGMTLPFLSDGGTSLIVSSLAVGLAIGAGRRHRTE
ncbi:FtsW/RodA/SpoVE family cell cycle protein [Engelhardtia mirabilis]|uniref:FtsW/RodA/SpoVE family cell cycle protein n=1 Tax=Engelhardtia mirabilis TaxID=2528011 RepID=UPI003AF339F2